LTRNDIVVSRDVMFIEGKPVNQTPAVYEEPRIIHDSITVLSEPPEAPMPPVSEHPDSDSEEEAVDPQILLQANEQPAIGGTAPGGAAGGPTPKTSARSNKGTFASTKFQDMDFDKKPRVRMAKIVRNVNPDDEDEPVTVQEAINHPTRGKQWEKAIRDEVNSHTKNHTWDLVPRPRNRQVITNNSHSGTRSWQR
jgi:hypothetical protein